MPFQYTFRADDIPTWDVDTRDLVENRDRELELYVSTIDSSLLNLNASNLASGTVPSSRVTGSYTGITQVGTLSAGVASYSIGDTGPAGGKVFITPSTPGNTTGLYFEVALISAEVERTWAQFAPINYTSTSVFVSNNIGTGKSNTVNIINQGNSNPDTCAAKYCDDYTYSGFSDWFLPSLDELAQIYTNRVVIGNNFAGKSYYSSSAYDDARAYWLDGSTGNQNYGSKSTALFVRPVRSFSATGLNVLGSAIVRAAATQDGVNLTGRAGGTSDYVVNILPTTLTASQTVTLPNVTGTAITTGNLSDITSVGTLTGLTSSGQITVNRGASGTLAGNFLTAINATATTAEGDSLLTRIRRINNGSTWETAAWRISRQVASTNMGFVQFGDGAGGQVVQFGVDNTVYGYVGTAGFFGVGANLTSLNATNLASGTVASARLSGAYTGITQLGTISPSLTVTGGSGTTITATTQTLINGTNNNAGIYLGNQTGSLSTGGIEASWRDALNPSIAIGVTRDGNKTMTIYEYSNFIYAYTNGTLRHQTSVNGFDVTGRVTISTQPAFMAGPAANYTLSNVSTVVMNSLLFNIGSAFNTGTYRFTAPVTGSYYFSYNANVYNMDTGVYWLPAIYKNGAVYMRGGRVLGLGANDSNQTVSGVVRLTAGDYVTAVIECNDPSYNISGGTTWNSFSGILIG